MINKPNIVRGDLLIIKLQEYLKIYFNMISHNYTVNHNHECESISNFGTLVGN